MLFEFQDKRLKALFHKAFNRLDKSIQHTLKERILDIVTIWNNTFSFRINGEVCWTNWYKTRCIVRLNIFTLRLFSDVAATGVIVHELAHGMNTKQESCVIASEGCAY
jgi:predicted SprT family Zn-dependent metalloprotease